MKARFAFGLLLGLCACGDRGAFWDAPLVQTDVLGLATGVAWLDGAASRAIVIRSRGGSLVREDLPTGRNVVATAVSTDGTQLAALATGELVQDEADDPKPALTVIDTPAGAPAVVRTFPLGAPHTGLALDPLGDFAVVHAGTDLELGSQLAENPNELIFVDLHSGAVVTRSLRSFGGRPSRFTFTPPLGLPGGARRLLLVETEQDLAILDLAHLDRPEITVRLTSGKDAHVVTPAGLVFDDGDPTRDDDTRIAVRTEAGADVVTLTLVAAESEPNGFTATINLANAGGVVSDLAFVQTDSGLRVAALVPSARKATLIEPDTSRAVDVELGASFTHLSLTGGDPTAVAASAAGDVALLYGSGSSASVGFWAFRSAPDRPYRTVELLPVTAPIGEIRTLVGHPTQRLALGAGSLLVLDLAARTASPLTTQSGASVHVAADGGRFWVYQRGGEDLARVVVDGLGLASLQLQRTVSAVFDVGNESGGRSLFAVDQNGSGALTVVDALAPDASAQVHVAGLFLMGAP